MPKDCDSCGMPIPDGRYCHHCVDTTGQLQPFDTRFERMVQWALREDPGLSRPDAEARTLRYVARMPAWSAHPRVVAAATGA